MAVMVEEVEERLKYRERNFIESSLERNRRSTSPFQISFRTTKKKSERSKWRSAHFEFSDWCGLQLNQKFNDSERVCTGTIGTTIKPLFECHYSSLHLSSHYHSLSICSVVSIESELIGVEIFIFLSLHFPQANLSCYRVDALIILLETIWCVHSNFHFPLHYLIRVRISQMFRGPLFSASCFPSIERSFVPAFPQFFHVVSSLIPFSTHCHKHVNKAIFIVRLHFYYWFWEVGKIYSSLHTVVLCNISILPSNVSSLIFAHESS